jgi:hypothetical protein
MPSQVTYARAKTLGPFLTLILLSSPKRGRALSQALRSASVGSSTSDYTPFAKYDEACFEPKLAPRNATAGPILALILAVERSHSEDLIELSVRI